MIPDYAALYASMTIPDDRLAEIVAQCEAIVAHRAQYESVGMGVTFQWIGAVHFRECGGRFDEHLHNGNPLTHRTVNEPAGRPPPPANPPFTWQESARDALQQRGFHIGMVWDLPTALHRAEAYNGMGYALMGILSSYVWAASNHQQPGKFVADRKFDPTVEDQQIGIAPVLLILAGMGFPLS